MDPFSISASVITVVTLAGQVAHRFNKLRCDYIELPGRLHALNNEVSDLQVVLQEVQLLGQDRANVSYQDQTALAHLLSRAEVRLAELDRIVTRLSAKDNTHHILRRATIWRKWHPKLQSVQNDLREIKGGLNVILGAANSRDLLRVRVDLAELSRTSSTESQEQSKFREKVLDDLALQDAHLMQAVGNVSATIEKRLSKLEFLLHSQSGRIRTASEFDDHYSPSPPNYTSPGPSPIVFTPRSTFLPTGMDPSAPVVSVRVQKRPTSHCNPTCCCNCHLEHRRSTSGYLERLVGQMFIGYSGLPLLNRCDIRTCRRLQGPSLSMEYWFPLGFCWSQILRLELAYHSNFGPQWDLVTMRQVPDSATCVTYALEGNISGLKTLFQNGLASPRDVSKTRGYTLLRWALYGQQFETARFLMLAGTDPGYRPIAASDDSPSEKACDIMLRGNIPIDVVDTLRLIARGSDWVEDQNFSVLHKIVLGLSLKDLESLIISNPDDIDVRDNLGRTALEWAAARGDERTVVTLLSFGANPNNIDKKLNTPLTLASNQGYTKCVRLLLEAGACTDPVLPPGTKFGTPLNCAARNAKDPLVIKTLLDFDANVEACGVDGMTPLLHVSRNKPAVFARLLLDYGAKINATSKDGKTPLTTSIIYNNHAVLKLLLDRWFEYTECPRLAAPHLIELVARHADLETMQLLSDTKHLKLRRDTSYAVPREKFIAEMRTRVDVQEDLIQCFTALLDILCQDVPVAVKTKPAWWRGGFAAEEAQELDLSSADIESFHSPATVYETPEESFVAAQDNFALKSDEMPTQLRRRLLAESRLAT